MTAPDAPVIAVAGEADLPDLLALMRAYCDFYAVGPSDEDLLALSRALIGDPGREGVQLIARDSGGAPLGFATVFWSWSTTRALRPDRRPPLAVARLRSGRPLTGAQTTVGGWLA